jgi:hypothetical protein
LELFEVRGVLAISFGDGGGCGGGGMNRGLAWMHGDVEADVGEGLVGGIGDGEEEVTVLATIPRTEGIDIALALICLRRSFLMELWLGFSSLVWRSVSLG